MSNKFNDFMHLTFHGKLRVITLQGQLLKTFILYKGFFKKAGKNFRLNSPLRLYNPHNITIGNDVTINHLGWLLTLQIDSNIPELVIDDGAAIGNFCHITCVKKVYIGKNVLAADRIYISDNLHGYEDITTPIAKQKVKFKGEVSIGENSWIGENVSIIGCKVGRHCVIGANSVVTKDIPDYSIAAGIPAKVIKRYDIQAGKWVSVKSEKGKEGIEA